VHNRDGVLRGRQAPLAEFFFRERLLVLALTAMRAAVVTGNLADGADRVRRRLPLAAAGGSLPDSARAGGGPAEFLQLGEQLVLAGRSHVAQFLVDLGNLRLKPFALSLKLRVFVGHSFLSFVLDGTGPADGRGSSGFPGFPGRLFRHELSPRLDQ